VREWLLFLASIANELYDLFQYVHTAGHAPDPEREKQLAMAIVRKASDAKMRAALESEEP
jgi:hypothetical protein